MKILTCAIRGRSDGDRHTSEHRRRLEIGDNIANSITSVNKDSLIILIEDEEIKVKDSE